MLKHFFSLLFFFPILLTAKTGDTLETFLANVPHDTASVRNLLSISETLTLTDQIAALQVSVKAVEIAYETKNPITIYEALQTLGIRYTNQGEYIKASQYLFPALRISDSLNDDNRRLRTLNSIGNLYAQQDQRMVASGYYEKALALAVKTNNKIREGVILGNLGAITYQNANEDSAMLEKAKNYFEQAREIAKENNQASREISACNNLILVLTDLKLFDEALQLSDSVLFKTLALNDSADLAFTLSDIGRIYYAQGSYDKAIVNFNQSLVISRRMNNRSMVTECYKNLSSCYQKKGDYKNAFDYLEKNKALDDSLINTSNTEIITSLKTKIDAERQQSEIDQLKQKNEIGDLRNVRQNLFLGITIGGLVLLGVFAFLLFNRARVKEKANKTLEKQNLIIAEKNKDITDSINYAKRIQESLFASEQDMKRFLPEFFIFFKPRDIVSGDFWWITKKEDKIFLCVADCTGHGVPGAFMSLLGISFLNEAVVEKGIHKPNEIFDHVRTRIITALSSEDSINKNSDGMDAVICCIDLSTRKITFACANNPVWIDRGGKLIEFRPDKMPVGKHHGATSPFSLQEVTLEKNDIVYLLSDGFPDQFGGEQGKKFKYKPLQQLLLANSTKSMADKKDTLEKTFTNWKGNLEQVDDVLLVGFKI